MTNLSYLFKKALFYRKNQGGGELARAILRKVLSHPYTVYRNVVWNSIRKKPLEKWLPRKALGLFWMLNPDDKGLSAEIAVEGIHEPFLTSLLEELIMEGMTVVDIGANIGYFALLESRLTGTKGKVIAIEPSPVTFYYLKQNLELNKANNVNPLNVAIGDRTGKATMYLYEQTNWNTLVPLDREFHTSVEVDTITLDELLEDQLQVDVIRMDIEGYECKIIYGMKKILERYNPLLIIEIHGGLVPLDNIAKLLNELGNMGYSIKCMIPRIKEEVFLGRPLANWKNVYEEITIDKFLNDDRLTRFRDNFTVVFQKGRSS
jgi:FkbM family methyltransferase